MPISFPSKSHGQIPIGFFNIETDMLLLDRYFFFSTSAEVFQDIIGYIQAGGMPGWLNGQPPDYVTRMMDHLAITRHRFFSEQSTRSVS